MYMTCFDDQPIPITFAATLQCIKRVNNIYVYVYEVMTAQTHYT